jgi:cephalosporin hydroxylase
MVDTLTEPAALDWLHTAASTVTPGHAIVELGVYRGGSLKHLITGAPDGVPVYGVDAWGLPGTYEGRPHMHARYPAADKRVAARIAKGATLLHALNTDAARDYTGPPVALLYIDSEHRHQQVLADYHAWKPHLTPDATVVFDDYIPRFPGVIQAVNELVTAGELANLHVIGSRLAATTRQ